MNTLTTAQVAQLAGITYRRLDHWAHMGYLQPEVAGTSGVARRWPDLEVLIACMMARLIDGGLTVPAAAGIARGAVEAGDDCMTVLAPGITLIISDDIDRRRIESTLPL